MLKRLALVVVLGGLTAFSTGAAQARNDVTIYAGLYTCYTSYATGFNYSGGVALYTNNRYAYSYSVAGGLHPRALRNPKWGRLAINGSRISFVGGPWRSYYGVITTARKFTVYLKGERSPYTFCKWQHTV